MMTLPVWWPWCVCSSGRMTGTLVAPGGHPRWGGRFCCFMTSPVNLAQTTANVRCEQTWQPERRHTTRYYHHDS